MLFDRCFAWCAPSAHSFDRQARWCYVCLKVRSLYYVFPLLFYFSWRHKQCYDYSSSKNPQICIWGILPKHNSPINYNLCQFLFFLTKIVRILNICKISYGQISLQFNAWSIIMNRYKGMRFTTFINIMKNC